ncbi:enoyl-acyl-carrier-proteinreductase 1 mitochondrial precursor [Pyronema domesticum]|uniref:enoyl-[acyl-carrier-protein] reductase n=1 Tax=Pyronema omphalodes (strain CBS 100304) TaxID=1076935 RepID=U4LMN2_PYROM|nr:enoyl-acyl-carrier-proteinreductase 1 mitochondrial precursor [Pyronema domesticum]CCX33208.1 Similar to Probable trans-2-enoyl-CoA reductase, mitochondrial; acc. no. Q6CBE4 [Pyronema omphalodes CBS 100304]
MASPLRLFRSAPRIANLTCYQRRHVSAFGYTQAKALVYSAYGEPSTVLKLHSHSLRPAYDEEILIKFLASPINPADINQIEGVYPAKPELTIALGTPEKSAVGGNEGVVEVVSVGANVKGYKPGDRAIMKHTSFGTWRTHALAKDENLLRIPDEFKDISPLSAATISVNPCTAYRMLKDFADLEEGDWFIQNGANSGVGRAAIQLGKIWGLKSVNVIRERPDVDALKKELMDLGADIVVTDAELQSRGFYWEMQEKTQGKGIKLGLNCVGGKATHYLIKCLGEGGHVVTYGAMSKQPLNLNASSLIFKDIHAHGFWVSRWSDRNPEAKAEMVAEIFRFIQQGKFKEVPFEKTIWNSDSTEEQLVGAVAKSGQAFGNKKQVFVFEE